MPCRFVSADRQKKKTTFATNIKPTTATKDDIEQPFKRSTASDQRAETRASCVDQLHGDGDDWLDRIQVSNCNVSAELPMTKGALILVRDRIIRLVETLRMNECHWIIEVCNKTGTTQI